MSRTPRRALHARPAHLAGAAVIVLLAACGGNGGSAADSTPAGSAPASTTAESEATGTAASGQDDFCTQAAGLDERVESTLNDLDGDNPSVADAFTELSAEFRSMDPPDEIASDWDAMAGGLDRMATAFADFDLTDPDTVAALEEAQGELSAASDDVGAYLREECGIDG